MTKRKYLLEISFLLLLALLFAWGTALERQQQRIADSMLRLHVVGASNSERDQEIKLQVRDAILTVTEPYFQSISSISDAKSVIRNHLGELEAVANETLSQLGCEDRASVTLSRVLFGTRVYDGFSLPGGYYDALNITIGAGEGRNWWCVVYPQICMASSVEQQEAVAVMGGMDVQDVQIITEDYTLKFKTLELFENLMGWFRSMGQGIPTSG